MVQNAHEKILILGIKEGNEKIFDHIFLYYYSGLVVYAQKFIVDRDVAEDIVQELFYTLWKKRQLLEINQSLKSYLFTWVKNRCIDYLRKKEVMRKNEADMLTLNEIIAKENDFFVESELREYIDMALAKMPPACREVFILNRFDELKPIEIATEKRISVRTVEGHIGKGLRIMREELRKYLPSTFFPIIIGALHI
jgi:RNA polymerase sigma-70 factor, ECF subfamily